MNSLPEIEQLARRLYAEGAGERGPAWDLLGDVTKSVWRERAAQQLYGDLA